MPTDKQNDWHIGLLKHPQATLARCSGSALVTLCLISGDYRGCFKTLGVAIYFVDRLYQMRANANFIIEPMNDLEPYSYLMRRPYVVRFQFH